MNKSCARCTKIVYPIEELKCLDKTWHKTCFKCHECGMTLNMKTYKGFNKLPYCEAHIPKAKATAIADTPELKRIAENTKIQSNVKYHADFEKQKGKLTQVADDPETLRMKQNSKIISNVAYHGDLEKKAAMEKQREVAEIADNRDNESEYFSETLAAESLSQYQPSPKHTQPPIVPIQQYSNNKQNESNSQMKANHQQHQSSNIQYSTTAQHRTETNNHHPNQNNTHHNAAQMNQYHTQAVYAQQQQQQQQKAQIMANHKQTQQLHQQQLQQKYYEQYEQTYSQNAHQQQLPSPTPPTQLQSAQQQQQQQQTHNYNNNSINNVILNNNNNHANQNLSMAYNNVQHAGQGYNSNSIQTAIGHGNQMQYNSTTMNNHHIYGGDYNSTLNSNAVPSPIGGGGGGGSIGKISDYDPITDGPRNIPNTTRPSSTLIYSSDRGMVSNNQPRKIGSIADIDPLNGVYGSIDYNTYAQQQQKQQQQQQQMRYVQQQQQPPIQQNSQSAMQQKPKSISSQVRVFRALYDYEAQDTDEVSFTEGDLIFEVDSIDAGWMTGRVERTGQTGMLPANYVEPI